MVKKSDYQALLDQIKAHNRSYYDEASPVISDYEYDVLVKRVEAIEQEHPEWVTENSPIHSTGESPTQGFKQVVHAHPMLSLANTYNEEELQAFFERMQKLLGQDQVHFACELKMDGVALGLRYEKGVLVQGVTRGDGKKGDDITRNVKHIASLPLQLRGEEIPDVLELRGEAYMPKKVFAELNTEREESGLDVWANPRNATAGSLKLLDEKVFAKRGVEVVLYGVAEESTKRLTHQSDVRSWLAQFGFQVFDTQCVAKVSTVPELMEFADRIEKKRADFPFEIDGIVVKIDALKEWKHLGVAGKKPRWAVAYKFAPEQAVTVVHDIHVQVGRTGVLTPVAELEPVFLAGSTISRATLHNQDEVERKDIRVGDTVRIEKGGDVIPKVVSVVCEKRPESSKPWAMPKNCPSCQATVIRVDGEVAFRCPNKTGCPDQQLRRIVFFISKGAMDIDSLGEKNAERFVELGLIRSLPDIYRLKREDLEGLEGFQKKSIDNLLRSIEESKKIPLARFIFSLGIPFVGAQTADLLAEHFHRIENYKNINLEDLVAIEGIGPKVAESIIAFFQDTRHCEEIQTLLELGVQPIPHEAKRSIDHDFNGKTFVLTGTLDHLTRSEATHQIKQRGGKVVSSVSKKVNFVLLGTDPGSKLDKARKLGVEILTEDEYQKRL